MNINISCQKKLTLKPLFLKNELIKFNIPLLLTGRSLYSKLCQFRVQNINFLHPIFAFNSNFKQLMLSKTMIMNFPKTLKKDIKLPQNFSVFGKHLTKLYKNVIKKTLVFFGKNGNSVSFICIM